MRVTSRLAMDDTLRRVQTRASDLERTRTQLATGRRISRPSDDPAGSVRALGLRAAQRVRQQESRNISDATRSLNLADDALSAVTTQLQRARDLAVGGANFQQSSARAAAADEIAAIRDQLVSLVNQKHDGRPLFAGFSDGPAVQGGPGTWSYGGDGGAVLRRVGEETVVQVNVTASDLLGFADGDDVLSQLDALETALRSDDQAAISGSLTGLDRALERVGASHTFIGATQARVDDAARVSEDALLTIRGELSEVEDTDLAEAVMELQLQEVAYESALQAMSRAFPPSLATFLR